MTKRADGRLRHMRLVLVLLAVLTVPAMAAIGWADYDNSQFGYRGGVPSGFSGYGEDESGAGEIFDRQPTMQVLSYWAEAVSGDFEHAVEATLANLEQQGWNVSFQTVTPDWASITGIMGSRRVQLRLILLCDRKSVATMTLQYSAAEAADIKPMVEELESGFVALGC
jgi:hypothetical protein